MVGIPTTGRVSLSETIKSVIVSAGQSGVKVKILVVTNGQRLSKDRWVDLDRPGNISISTVHVPELGYANVRNAILENLDAPVLAMVDDDEVVSDDWVAAGLTELETFDAAVITGPVNYLVGTRGAEWIRRRQVFASPLRSRGEAVGVCSSNNIFVDTTRAGPLPKFDPRYNQTGGEDTDWTHKLHAAGKKIIWSPRVSVAELVESKRLNRNYIRSRFRNNGRILALTIYSKKSILVVCGGALARIILGTSRVSLMGASRVLHIHSVPRWYYNDAEGMAWRGVGMISGLAGRLRDARGDRT